MDDKFVTGEETGVAIPGGCGSRSEPRLVDFSVCSGYADLVVDLSDGELPPDQQQAVREHVETCAGCRAELARLDASLVQLAQGIVISKAETVSRPSRYANRRVGLTLAATSLVCVLALIWLAWPASERPVAKVPTVELPSQPLLSPADALRQIALVEQCARLQTSLELLPDDPAYADERAANERLLVRFQEAAAEAPPRNNQGETL
jgi:hypothetical protein